MLINKIRYKINQICNQIYRYFLNLSGYECFICLGDSHSAVLNYIRQQNLVSKATFVCYPMPGATVSGIRNSSSKTGAISKIRKVLKNAGRWNSIIVLLGEIDCGYTIWYKVEQKGIPLADAFNTVIARYQDFLNELKDLKFKKILVISAPLPPIPDHHTLGETAQIRSIIQASRHEKTQLTINFNQVMENWCQENQILYINTTQDLLDPNTLILKDEYDNHNPYDHHLSIRAYSNLLVSKLQPLIDAKLF